MQGDKYMHLDGNYERRVEFKVLKRIKLIFFIFEMGEVIRISKKFGVQTDSDNKNVVKPC